MTPPSGEGDGQRVRKRRRIVISCTECHRRKQRCDRELPCGNCRSRNKESACIYETGAPTTKESRPKRQNQQTEKALEPSPAQSSDSTEDGFDELLSSKAADWGYAQNGASTMGLLKQIETATDGEHGSPSSAGRSHEFSVGSPEEDLALREKYKGIIRQLPARSYIDKLVEMYMRGFNWQYFAIDPVVFYAQLEQWNNLPFSTLSTVGPRGLSPELRAFPALIFQVIATALLLLPERPDPVFDSLKYAGSMRFEDLAVDYSDSGQAVVDLLGKKHLSLVTVQAQFLRASFFKFTAKVTEAWHTIAMATRDAQELGLHRDSLDPKPKDSSIESVLENQWVIQRRRRMYSLLAVWDLNCAMVLGRPGTIDWNQLLPTPPVDAILPENRDKSPIVPRGEDDPPTPITRLLWNYQLCGPLREIMNLENEGSYPVDFSKVDQVHQSILDLDKKMPPSFRLENPDTRWDDRPEAHWYRANRYYFAHLHQFSKTALHRPYVFNRKESRVEAINSSLRTLEIQKMTFEGLPPDSWRNFMLFFSSFDAIVLIASVYIIFPQEYAELTSKILEHFQWTIERFSAMQERNPLAKSAQGVLRAIVVRFKRAVAKAESTSLSSTENRSTAGSSGLAPTSTPGSSSLGTGDVAGLTQSQPAAENAWRTPPADSLASMAPFFPTGDLIYNDLTAGPDGMMLPLGSTEGEIGGDDLLWQFGGDWGDDTVWQMLNQFPATGDGGPAV
ncbi:Zn(2)-C6 fungal-type domain-containing protein [Fusarium sp. LHS14.1]|nr:Zn(2)-C6 fungal-type domain-containing protein [Fusarium sp. LHS14.1]